MATKQKHIHSFSTNFFGVVGYAGSTMVWLLVITCATLFIPYEIDTELVTFVTGSSSSGDMVTSENAPYVLNFLLYVLLAIVFWAFVYFASKILSRIVRRIALLFAKKVTTDTFFRAKYFIHAIGLVALVLFVMITPAFPLEKATIAFLGLVSGIVGIAAVLLQRRLADRHKVPLAHIL